MMAKYAVVNKSGIVENIIVWDGISSWTGGHKIQIIKSDDAGIGDTYVDGVFTKPIESTLSNEIQF
ncbi:hypothetical protein ACULTK_004353 [Yersinia enterocolitica]|nr:MULTISPECIES: hypothetical protein [Yersinia]EKN3458631.1 hypothetical protein [Yersinia enterocolitica]EKN3499886.1 hypothetical protein [Yersinia enterocolitica]EKN3970525.1 hypothetical protein [Yersinia enterocolitica]EKN4035334.1 hypothetical protein [Yersinia enterocolitica]EKN4063280.1 hypothetical protein [Yersinia enterocolitica]